jgi:hypothetical protein
VLFGEHGADETPDRWPVRKEADDVSSPPDLLVQPLPDAA